MNTQIKNINGLNNDMKNIILKKKTEEMKIKRFLYDRWHFDDEFPFVKSKYDSNTLNHINILSDINKFGIKKQSFVSKMSIVN